MLGYVIFVYVFLSDVVWHSRSLLFEPPSATLKADQSNHLAQEVVWWQSNDTVC